MNVHRSFEEFSKGFGFETYPFNSFTAENEKDEQQNLFVSTKLYSPIFEAFEAGQTIILSGDRGTGKTSITYDFVRRSTQDHLVCRIDDFSAIKQGFSEPELYKFILMNLVNTFFSDVANLRSANRNLNEDEKILLTYYYINFAGDATRGLANRTARLIQVSPYKRFLQKIYNILRRPLNIVANVGVGILADIVARASGASTVTANVMEYFPEIISGVEGEFPKAEDSLEALRRFSQLARNCGYKRVVVILDKIDEDKRLENAAEEIAEFIEPILTNNKFLLDSNVQIVISIWVVPLQFIKDKVRTQKIDTREIKWDSDDLRQAYDRRIDVFSSGTARTFENTFLDDVSVAEKEEILELSNNNPRDLWHLMNRIFRAQYSCDENSNFITHKAIEKGMEDFVTQFNFYEYYPRKANARANSMDAYSYIRHLQKLESPSFTRNQLSDKAGTGSSTQNYTVGMESLGLIEKDVSDKGEVRYQIRDPKVRYAIARSIKITKD